MAMLAESRFGQRMRRGLLGALAAAALGMLPASAQAAQKLPVRLLTTAAGTPESPDSLKLAFTMPADLQGMKVSAANTLFFIYPAHLTPQQGAVARYRADGVLFWQHGDLVFADLRLPPKQEDSGEYTLFAAVVQEGKVLALGQADHAVTYRSGTSDVILVIDSSQSMSRNDPRRRRVTAASAFLEMAARDGRIGAAGLVHFNDAAEVLSPMVGLAQKERLLAALKKVHSSGQTNIGLALETALEQFDSASLHRKAVVFLTDGRNESVPYAEQHRQFAARGIPVYCIGLSDAADMSLLERIAGETGGKAFRVVDDQGLMTIYMRIAAELGRRQVVLSKTLAAGENRVSVPVDSAVRQVTFALDAGRDKAQLTLVPPTKAAVAPVQYAREGYQELRVDQAQSGMWQVTVQRLAGAENEPLTLTVSADTRLFLDVFPLVVSGENLLIGATLAADGRPVVGGRVNLLPDRNLPAMQLFDDGQHQDGAANDGIYAGIVDRPAGETAQKARLVLRAWGQMSDAPEVDFLRQADAGEALLPGRPAVKPAPPQQALAQVTVQAPTIEASKERTAVAPQQPKPAVEKQEQPAAPAETVASSAIDFGRAAPGQKVTAEFTLRYAGKGGAFALSCSDMRALPGDLSDETKAFDQSDATAITLPQLELQKLTGALQSGERTLRVSLTLPANARNGVYSGQVRMSAGSAQTTAMAKVEVVRPELRLPAQGWNLGYVQPGGETSLTLPVTYDGPAAEKLTVQAEGGWAEVRSAQAVVQPGEQNEIALTLVVRKDLPAGQTSGRLVLQAGAVSRVVALTVQVPERGMALRSRLPGHELALLPAGAMQRASLPAHELRLRPAPVVTPVPPVARALPQTQTAPVQASALWLQTGGLTPWTNVILLAVAGLAAAALLLLLRRLLSNRMARFALLSAALHLPLLAFIAGYLLIVARQNDNATPAAQKDAELLAAALVADSAADQPANREESGVAQTQTEQAEKKLLAGQAAQSGQEARFAPAAMTRNLPLARDAGEQSRELAAKASAEKLPVAMPAQELQRQALRPAERPQPQRDPVMTRLPERMPQRDAAAQPAVRTVPQPAPQQVASARQSGADGRTAAVEQLVPGRALTGRFSREQIKSQDGAAERVATAKPQGTPTPVDASAALTVPAPEDRVVDVAAAGKALRPAMEAPERMVDALVRPVQAPATEDSKESTARSRPESQPQAVKLPVRSVTKSAGRGEKADRPVGQAVEIQAAALTLPEEKPEQGDKPLLADGRIAEPLRVVREPGTQPVKRAALTTASTRREPSSQQPAAGGRPDLPPVTMDEKAFEKSRDSGKTLEDARAMLAEVREPERLVAGLPKTAPGWNAPVTGTSGHRMEQALPLVADDGTREPAAEAVKPLVESAAAGDVARLPGAVVSVAPRAPEIAPAALPAAQVPGRPEAAERPVSVATAELVRERERFAGRPGGSAYERSSAATGSVAGRVDTETVRVSAKAAPLSGAADRVGRDGLARTEAAPETAAIAQADSTGVSLMVGVLGEPGLFRGRRAGVPVQEIAVQTGSLLLRNCQLVVVRREAPLREAELRALREYLRSGGKLWFCGQPLPEMLAGEGSVTGLTPEHPLYVAQHDLRGRLREGQWIAGKNPEDGGIRALSVRAKQAEDLPDLADNVLLTLLGGNVATGQEEGASDGMAVAGQRVKWQDFSQLPQGQHGWSAEKWGDPARLGLAPDGQGGEALLVALMRGTEGKTALSFLAPETMGRRMDLSGCRALVLDVFHPGSRLVRVSALFTTNGPRGWDQFETRSIVLRPGWNRGVTLAMDALRARSGGGSEFNSPLEGARECARITLLLRASESGDFLLDNLQWVR